MNKVAALIKILYCRLKLPVIRPKLCLLVKSVVTAASHKSYKRLEKSAEAENDFWMHSITQSRHGIPMFPCQSPASYATLGIVSEKGVSG